MPTKYEEQHSFLYTLRGIGAEAKNMVYPPTKVKMAVLGIGLSLGLSLIAGTHSMRYIVQQEKLNAHRSLPLIAQKYDINKDGRLEGREMSRLVDALKK